MSRALPVLTAVLAALTALGGCSSTGSNDSDKYTQTWPAAYSATTCAEWHDEMTAAQQWAAAADMLTAARNKGDGGTGLPPDTLVDEFRSGIGLACEAEATATLADIATGLYLTERATFQP
jgi:hypothetical protein